MRRVDKPWGYELIWVETDRYVGKILHIEAGHRLSFQYHKVKDEALLQQVGEMDLLLENDEGVLVSRRMEPGDSVHIPAGRRHRMTAVTDCDVVEVSTPELDDIVRLEDDYARVVPNSVDDG
ncbi:MAG TPA: cupin [Deltaproteobacteria bacterium]|nr:cupin [Deltaproteobacteria bacterium]